MTSVQKSISVFLWLATVACMAGLLVAWPRPAVVGADSGAAIGGTGTVLSSGPLYAAPEFKLTDQSGKPLGSADLRGHPYICDFIFTTCQGACPMMSARMAELQGSLPAEIRLVSFTVDPDHDDVKAMHNYSLLYHADPNRWFMLTGPKQAMYDAAIGMKVMTATQTLSPLSHSEKLFLVDAQGQVVLMSESSRPAELGQLVAAATALCANKSPAGAPMSGMPMTAGPSTRP